MPAYLITGQGGSGKSTIHSLLKEKGYASFDSDEIPGLARAEDMAGNPVDVDWSGYVDYSKIAFNWQPSILDQFLVAQPDVIICGSASNQLQLHDRFDKVYVLTLPRTVHQSHLLGRKSVYGKDPDMLAYLLNIQESFAQEAIALGAVAIDASVSPKETLNQVLGFLHEPK